MANEKKESTAASEKEKTVRIRLPRIAGNPEDEMVSVNEKYYTIKRGVEVDVPECVAEVLRHREEQLEHIYEFNEKNKA